MGDGSYRQGSGEENRADEESQEKLKGAWTLPASVFQGFFKMLTNCKNGPLQLIFAAENGAKAKIEVQPPLMVYHAPSGHTL